MVKVSVIIPIYNDEEYLRECMDSVVHQTLKDIEILCINDGSTDGTADILKQYSIAHHNIKVINQKNQGAAVARNRAIKLAQGRYVAFMDGDDYYPNNDVLEGLYETAVNENVKICGGSYIQNKRGKIIKDFHDGKDRQVFLHNERKKFLDFAFPMNFTKYIYSRELLLDNNIVFPNYSIWEDPLFLISAMIHAEEFFAVTQQVYVHRVSIHHYRFDYKTIIQILEAFTDAMKMAFYNNNLKLQINCAQIIFSRYYPYICAQFLQYKEEMCELLQKIEAYILPQIRDEVVFLHFIPSEIEKYIVDARKKISDLNCFIDKYDKLIIYGAGDVGQMFYEFLTKKQKGKVIGFAVTEQRKEKWMFGLPVRKIDDWKEYGNCLFIIAVTKYYQREMQENLLKKHIGNSYVLDAQALRLQQTEIEMV